MEVSIYKINTKKRLNSLKLANISKANKRLILSFASYCFSEGLGEHRVLKYAFTLKRISRHFPKDFDRLTEEEMREYIAYLEISNLSDWTKHDYKVALKKFYKWLNGGEEPLIVKWIRTTFKKRDRKLPEDMLTEDEIKQLIDAATNKRDKTIIALLWDIGARIGEIGTLRIKHVKFDDIGGIIIVNGKTGCRRVRAVWSVPYLMDWLEEHPERDNPEAPLWFKFAKNKEGLESMRYDAIRMQLSKISKKAGVNKKIHPHLFRHSRCTYMANYLTEAQMNAYFGWVQGSGMPSIYVHLSGRDIDDAVLKANGIT
ncbi:MAG: tyrosine-type recombinase/integrase, partial [Bacteroidota bacterium]|nr:tyrosine-type recombinase/integrase [Bacteroidota bacterium]